jgi:Holliday junction resolvasome RuvABC endonuclease subunit
VARMVALELALPAGRIAADATDALAVALAQAHREGLESRLRGRS